MSTVIIQGLKSRRLVAQGYGYLVGPPGPQNPLVMLLRHLPAAVNIRLTRATVAVSHEPARIQTR
ncbi:MAG: hypothetical protein N2512_08975 [Armatimonadetes bacterium]|nr:hypothetical protein [Armatimonadota bacterium]